MAGERIGLLGGGVNDSHQEMREGPDGVFGTENVDWDHRMGFRYVGDE